MLLLRDPYDSIWSEFQRRMSDSHVGGIPHDVFDVILWLSHVCNLANRYLEMWSNQYKVLEQVCLTGSAFIGLIVSSDD